MATTLAEGAGIINESLRNLGYDYQIDTTSAQTITEGLEKIGAYPPNQLNQIMEQMNLVLQYRNYGVMFDASKNAFRAFLIDLMETGMGVEDVFHELLDSLDPLWDNKTPETTQEILEDLVSYDTAKIHRAFHVDGDSARFKATIDTRNYRKVFTPQGVTRYLDTKLANLSWSAEKWLMDKVVALITAMASDGKIKTIDGLNLNTKDGVANAVEVMKATMAGFLTPSNEFNYGVYDESSQAYRPVVNMTNSESDIFIVTTPENFMRIKVQGYTGAFNLSQFELEGRIIYAPAGTDLGEIDGKPVLFYVFDRRAILVGIKHWQGGTFVVPNAARVNQWLLTEILKGYNTFFNAVAFTGESVANFFGGEGGAVTLVIDNTPGAPLSYAVNDEEGYTQYSESGIISLYGVNSLRLKSPGGTTFALNDTGVRYDGTVHNYEPLELLFGGGTTILKVTIYLA